MGKKSLILILNVILLYISPCACFAEEPRPADGPVTPEKTTCPQSSEILGIDDQPEMEEEMSPNWNFFSTFKQSVKEPFKDNKAITEAVDFLPEISGLLRYAFWFRFGTKTHKPGNNINRIFLWADKDFYDGLIGYHFDFQYQQYKFGQFPRAAWMQEGYGYIKTPAGKVKIGQIFTPFGVLWDHSFYGGTIYYKGYMYDADYGVVLENSINLGGGAGINYSFGYYWRSDGLNGATAIGEGIEKTEGGEKNTFVGRINPSFKIGEDINLSFGASVQGGGIRHPNSHDQLAIEADGTICWGPISFLGEWVYYDECFPSKNPELRGNLLEWEVYWDVYRNKSSRMFKAFVLKYNYSQDRPESGTGLGNMHQPAMVFEITDSFKVEALYENWNKAGKDSENSLWIILYFSF